MYSFCIHRSCFPPTPSTTATSHSILVDQRKARRNTNDTPLYSVAQRRERIKLRIIVINVRRPAAIGQRLAGGPQLVPASFLLFSRQFRFPNVAGTVRRSSAASLVIMRANLYSVCTPVRVLTPVSRPTDSHSAVCRVDSNCGHLAPGHLNVVSVESAIALRIPR